MSERRSLVDSTDSLSVRAQCRLLGLHRSGLYYENQGESALNLNLMSLMDEHYHYHPEKGARRMHIWLTKDLGYPINRKRIDRLYYEVMGLRAVMPGPHTSKRHKNHPVYPYLLRNLPITYPNQVWATDITYMPLPRGFMYLTAVIDLFSRFVLSWSLSNTMESDWCVEMVAAGIEKYGKPEIFNTDQGAQYTSEIFSKYITGNGIKLSMDGKGRATDNAFIERLWRTVKYENARFSDYTDGNKMYRGLCDFFEYYNQRRRHSSIGDEAPQKIYENAQFGISNQQQS